MTLDIKNLYKKFDSHTVLEDISIRVDDVESIVVVGLSGGGKTTLLRILAGLEIPTSGEVIVNNHTLDFLDKNSMRDYRRQIGMVFQAYNLFPHLSAMENIVLPLTKIHRMHKDEAHIKAEELFDRFLLKDHAHKKPSQLSGGQQQRIAICRAIALNPEFLLLDEPTSALDPEMTTEIVDVLKDLREMHIQFIMVTHNISFARDVADYMFFMNQAKILEHGKSKDFFDKPESDELHQFLSKILIW